MRDSSDGIYDDGEWISWDWINQQLYQQDLKEQYPSVDPHLAALFEDFVRVAEEYKEQTGRYLQVWGEMGEMYAEVKLGLKLLKPHAQGADGKLGNDFVEVKTISPEKNNHKVEVKMTGNFNRLLIVRISDQFHFEAAFIDRSKIKSTGAAVARVNWKDAEKIESRGDSEDS